MNLQNKIRTIGNKETHCPAVLIREKTAPKRNQKGNVLTKCFCPKCERNHFVQLRWSGRGRPRKFCRRCKSRLFSSAVFDPPSPYELS